MKDYLIQQATSKNTSTSNFASSLRALQMFTSEEEAKIIAEYTSLFGHKIV